MHKSPLYAFKLSDAIDFSKLDAKFANFFFDLQTTDTTQASGNSINNLVVFVFDKTTKKRVGNRAFNLNLSGFASVDSEDFIDNFIDKNSSFEVNPQAKLLKSTFPSGSILPSAFAVKFQDELTNKLRKAAPEAFQKAKEEAQKASTTRFQEQPSSGSTESATPAASAKPAEAAKVATKLPEIPNDILNQALEETLKEFGQLKLVSASGLQSLISNNYTLLPVNSTKSFIKIAPDDQNGSATIDLKLVDKNKKEKTIQLKALGFNSIKKVIADLSAKILKNQQSYFSLRPEVQRYLEKNPTFNLSEYAHNGIATQIKQLFQESEKEFAKKPETPKPAATTTHTTTPATTTPMTETPVATALQTSETAPAVPKKEDTNNEEEVKKFHEKIDSIDEFQKYVLEKLGPKKPEKPGVKPFPPLSPHDESKKSAIEERINEKVDKVIGKYAEIIDHNPPDRKSVV